MVDYGNTRLRAVKSRLLPREELEAMADSGGLDALVDRLLKTRYRRPLERALAASGGIRAVDRGVRMALEDLVEQLREDFPGSAGRGIRVLLEWQDLQNVRALLRGLQGGRPPDEIERAFTLTGTLDLAALVEVARADGLREGINRMAALRLPPADPLVRYRADHPGGGLFEFEFVLNRWFFRMAREHPDARPGTPLADWLRTLIDHENVQTALRFAHYPGLRRQLKEERGMNPEDVLLDSGDLGISRLVKAAESDSIESALKRLAYSRYAKALERGLADYRQLGRLSAFEDRLHAQHLGRLRRAITMQPLGMAVPIGVLALKRSEAANLRWIAWGIHIGLDSAEIKEELIYPG